MPSKKRLLRKMVQPWFLQQQQQQQSSEEMAIADTINFDLFIKEFEQEFIDWLLIALRESDSTGLLQEILKGKSISSGTLRQLFRAAGDYGGMPEPGDDLETGANEQESGNEVIGRRNENRVILDGSQGEQAGGHQTLDLEQIIIEGEKKTNNENLDKEEEAVQDNKENGCGSSNELSPVGESLKWFVQDGKGTIRRRTSGGSKTASGKCEGKNEWPPHHHHHHQRPYSLEQLLSQFKHHRESSERDEESICQSDESGIESLTQDDDTTDDSGDDDDDNELDKTLVPQDYNNDP